MIKGKRYFVSTSLNLAQQTEAHVITHVHNTKWFYCFKVLYLILANHKNPFASFVKILPTGK